MAGITPKQLRFVDEYMIDFNATQAAIRAGYSEKTAYSQGQRLLKNVEVQAEIAKRSEKHAAKLDITAERILAAIAAVAFGDIRGMFDENGQLLRPHDWDDQTAASVAGFDVVTVNLGEGAVEYVAKIKRADNLRGLDMLARHQALYNDKLDVTVTDGLADRIVRAKKRAGLK